MRLLTSLISICGLAASAVAGPIRYVDPSATGANNGQTWHDAYLYLDSAVTDAIQNGSITEIRVACGVYYAGPGNVDAAVYLPPSAALKGGYVGASSPEDPDARDLSLNATILSAAHFAADPSPYKSAVWATGSHALLEGFTIVDGVADGDPGSYGDGGGGLFILGGSPTISHCFFVGNIAKQGGGVRSDSASPTFDHCSFSSNSAGEGAGLYAVDSTVSLQNCAFDVGAADLGAGVLAFDSTIAAADCSFTGGTAQISGGALLLVGSGDAALSRCTLRSNSAQSGGAILNNAASLTLTDCIVGANAADFSGGAIEIRSGVATLVNCALAGNASLAGGAIFNRAELSVLSSAVTENAVSPDDAVASAIRGFGGSTHIANSIIFSNHGPAPSQLAVRFAASSLESRSSDVQGGQDGVLIQDGSALQWGVGNIDASPTFVNALGYDAIAGTSDDNLHLAPGSPCIDAGNNNDVPPGVTSDLDAADRFRNDPTTADSGIPTIPGGPIVDIGPLEFRGVACPWDLNADGVVNAVDLSTLLAGWSRPFGSVDLGALLGGWGPCPPDR